MNPFDTSGEGVLARISPILLGAHALLRAEPEDDAAPAPTLIEPGPLGRGAFLVTATASEMAIAYDPEAIAVAPLLLAPDSKLDAAIRDMLGTRRKSAPDALTIADDDGELIALPGGGVRVPIARHAGPTPLWRQALATRSRATEVIIDARRLARYGRVAALLHKWDLMPRQRPPLRVAQIHARGPVEVSIALKTGSRFAIVAMPLHWPADDGLRLVDWLAQLGVVVAPPRVATVADELVVPIEPAASVAA